MDFNHRPLPSQGSALYRLSYTFMAENRRFELPQCYPGTLEEVAMPVKPLLKWKRVEESNPQAFNPGAVFRTVYPHGCYPPKNLAGVTGFEPARYGFWRPVRIPIAPHS